MARVLMVCTGNICRSPAAELLLRAVVDEAPELHVESAGVDAVVGAPVAPQVAKLLRGRGVDPSGFRARGLEKSMLARSDLVLTMTARQRSQVVRVQPAALRRTFTLRELVRVHHGLDLTDLPDAADVGKRVQWLAEHAALARSAPRRPRLDDIADPYGGPSRGYRRAVEAIGEQIAALARTLLD